MSSKREEEKIEKIIRGLMKLPPNRRCINCNSMGPQYVCTNFWTFVCTACSGIHREFTHRVKSVSMAKFTTQEVEALQKGGNQIAREIFLKDWDMQRMRFPDSRNADKIREFIKDVYVNKKYAGSKHSGKPPRDVESFNDHGLEQRRASSYHSFSQSPPYEYQYEDRRYGKQFGILNRKPGSPYDGKMNSFTYSPGRLHMQTYEDKFANESSGSRMSDFSVSSLGDTFKFDGQSLNSQCSSPSLYHGRDITTEDTRPQAFNLLAEANVKDELPGPKRTLSAGSFGSASVGDVALEPVHSTGTQQAKTSTFSSTQLSASACPGNKNLFNSTFVQEPMVSSPSADLFANFSNQSSSLGQSEHKPDSGSVSHISLDSLGVSDIALDAVHVSGQQQPKTSTFSSISSISTGNNDPLGPTSVQPPKTSSDLFANIYDQFSSAISNEHKPATVSIPQNEGWATFDLPHNVVVDSTLNSGISALELSDSAVANKNVDGLSSMQHSTDWLPVQNPTAPGPLPVMHSQWHLGSQEHTGSTEQNNLQLWNAFDGSVEKVDDTSVGCLPQSRLWLPAPDSPFHDSNVTLKVLEDFDKDGFQKPAMDALAPGFGQPLGSVAGSLYSSLANPLTGGVSKQQKSTNPFDLPYDAHLEPMNMLDTSPFEAALPSSQLTNDYLASIAQPWYSQNAAVTHVSPLSEGGLQYMPGQGPSTHFPNFPSQGPGASVGGNPFA